MHDPSSPQPPYNQPVAAANFDTFGRAWTMLKPHIPTWAAAYAVYVLVVILSNRFDALWEKVSHPNAVVNAFLFFCGFAISTFVVNFMMCGLYRMAINHVKRGHPDINDLFSIADVIPAIFIASLILPFAIVFGLFMCIIPGFIIAGVTLFTQPLIVDKKMGFFQALRASCATLNSHLFDASFFVVRLVIFTLAGALACLVGVLVTGPLGILATALLYQQFFGDGVTGDRMATGR